MCNSSFKVTERSKRCTMIRTLPSIQPGDATCIHVKMPEGRKPIQYQCIHDTPRSHMIKAGVQAREYRRNRSMLMRTGETPHIIIPRNQPVPMSAYRFRRNVQPPADRAEALKIAPRMQQTPRTTCNKRQAWEED